MKILIVILLLISIGISNSQEFQYSSASYKTFLTIYAGYAHGENSADFYELYVNSLGGRKKSFKSNPYFGISFKYQYFDHFKFGLSAGYLSSSLEDSYTEVLKRNDVQFYRNIDENIKYETLPIMLTLDYIPIEIPYRTYLGIGAGIALNTVKWTELVSSDMINNERISGTVINENFVSPAAKIYAGVELDFDKEYKYSMVGGLILEAQLHYIYRYKNYLANAEQTFFKKSEVFNKNFTILPYYICLNIGVSLNFYKFK